jgi:hypothetical protein
MANKEIRKENLKKMMEIAADKETPRRNIIIKFDPEANLRNDLRVIRGKKILSEKF